MSDFYLDTMGRIAETLDSTIAHGVSVQDAMDEAVAILRPHAEAMVDDLYSLVNWKILAQGLEDWLIAVFEARPFVTADRTVGTWWLFIVEPAGKGLDIELTATANRCLEQEGEEVMLMDPTCGRFAPLREFGLRTKEYLNIEGVRRFTDCVSLTQWALPLFFLLHTLIDRWPRVEERTGLTLAGPADVGAAWSGGDLYCLTSHIIAARDRKVM